MTCSNVAVIRVAQVCVDGRGACKLKDVQSGAVSNSNVVFINTHTAKKF